MLLFNLISILLKIMGLHLSFIISALILVLSLSETFTVLYKIRGYKSLDTIAIFMIVSYMTIFIFRFTFLLVG